MTLSNWGVGGSGGGGGGAVDSVNEKTGIVVLDKTDIGLDQVDNTADLDKSVSVAQSAAIVARLAKSTYDANSIVKADTDDTPVALSVPASSIVGRLAAGGIGALNTSEVLTLLGRTDEHVQDLVGDMVTGNVESGGVLTYDDTTGKINMSAVSPDTAKHINPGNALYTNIDRYELTTSIALTSGSMLLAGIALEAGVPIATLMAWWQATPTVTNLWLALYDPSFNLVAQTEDIGSSGITATSVAKRNLPSTYVVPTSGLYQIGVVSVGTTPGSLRASNGGNANIVGTAPVTVRNSNSGLSTTAPATATQGSTPTTAPWVGVGAP